MFILALTFVLLTISITLYFIDRRNEFLKWFAFISFLGSLATAAVFLREEIMPVTHQWENVEVLFNVWFTVKLLLYIGAVFGPYPVVMFTVSYSQLFTKSKNQLGVIFLIPLLVLFIVLKEYGAMKGLAFIIITITAVIYYIIGCYIMLYSYLCEKNFVIKKQRFIMMIFYIPIFFYVLAVNYLAPMFQIFYIWKLNYVIILYIILLFVFTAKYGAMGIRLRIERNAMNSSTRLIASGFLNHTLKNEIGKIAIIADNLKYIEKKEEIEECILTIKDSAVQMREMITRINQQVQDVCLKEVSCSLNSILDNAIKAAFIYLDIKNIELIKEYKDQFYINCDTVHVQEVFVNILKNAAEATGSFGKIFVSIYRNKSYVIVEIRDTGCGISKENLQRVSEPFWSTKNSIQNSGLGLTYCNRIMQFYGSISFFSKDQNGTTVYLNFSSNKIIKNTRKSKKLYQLSNIKA